MTGTARFFQRARRRALLELDGLNWRRDLAALRAQAAGPANRRMLFCNLMTMIAGAKVEALIAAAMRPRGIEPVLLLHRRDRILENIFRAASDRLSVLYFDDYLARFDADACRREAEAWIAGTPDLDALVARERDGFRIGRNALSMVVRRLRLGRLDLDDARHRAEMTDGLAASLHATQAARALIAEVAPRHAMFNERGYTPAGEVFDACLSAGVDALQWFGAPNSDGLMYKRYTLASRGDHPMAISSDRWCEIQTESWSQARNSAVAERIVANYASGAWYNRQNLQDGKVVLDRADVVRRLGLDPGRKTATIFAHILYDATFFYGTSLFSDYGTWLVETVRAAIANPALNWIVKVHPVNVWRAKMDGAALEQLEAKVLREAFGELPGHIRLMPADTDINTFSLFDAIDYGLTVRGTIGMELPCFGIPVVTAGSGRYSDRGITIDPASVADYRALLGRLQDVPRLDDATVRRARQHYHAAILRRPITMDSFRLDYEANTFGLADLKTDTRVRGAGVDARSLGSLARVAQWIADETSGELMRDHD